MSLSIYEVVRAPLFGKTMYGNWVCFSNIKTMLKPNPSSFTATFTGDFYVIKILFGITYLNLMRIK